MRAEPASRCEGVVGEEVATPYAKAKSFRAEGNSGLRREAVKWGGYAEMNPVPRDLAQYLGADLP